MAPTFSIARSLVAATASARRAPRVAQVATVNMAAPRWSRGLATRADDNDPTPGKARTGGSEQTMADSGANVSLKKKAFDRHGHMQCTGGLQKKNAPRDNRKTKLQTAKVLMMLTKPVQTRVPTRLSKRCANLSSHLMVSFYSPRASSLLS